MNYNEFIQSKMIKHQKSGFIVDNLPDYLYDFQKHIVKLALEHGKYAIFADCGLGKTIMQLVWGNEIIKKEGGNILILCPLAVSGQTIEEGAKFGIDVTRWKDGIYKNQIVISNYEQLHKIDISGFKGIVLDESSILKNFTGKTKNLIINSFANTPYKLACTATPSPNDLNELGNHSKFLDVMDSEDMRARWFIRDEGINNYRLKHHAEVDFYSWVGTWASVVRTPADCGYNQDGFILPDLNYIEINIQTTKQNNGELFNNAAVNATNFNYELRRSIKERMDKAAEIVNNTNEPFIVWVKQNAEADYIKKIIPGSTEVRGNELTEIKEKKLLGFAKNEFRVLITKAKIAQFGLNYQHCNNQIFASLDFSFESLYQAVRRSYRFKQTKPVNIYILKTDTMKNVVESIRNKENQFNTMINSVVKFTNGKRYKLKSDYDFNEIKNEYYHIMNGDSVDIIKLIESDSIDLSIFSPPFSTLFTYSDNIRDMGNCASNEEFFKQNEYLLKELYRVIRPGRIVAVHTKDLARYKNSSGYTGLYDFTGDYHRQMEKAGFKYHSKITIWTDPVLEMQRTKTQRLLYKQVTKDSSYSGVGLPEYVTLFKKWEGNEEDWTPITNITKKNFPLDLWQSWASPVWFDISRTDVLKSYRDGKTEKDEKHICPLQLSVIERIIQLWSNEGERVFTPFAGIGSEVYQAVKYNRYGIGIELKESYYDTMARLLEQLTDTFKQVKLFSA